MIDNIKIIGTGFFIMLGIFFIAAIAIGSLVGPLFIIFYGSDGNTVTNPWGWCLYIPHFLGACFILGED